MSNNGQPWGRVPGSRREKVFGYLKAANELRQSYQSQLSQRLQSYEDDYDMPGNFPDVEIVRSGYEEMLLFPSYAKRRIKKSKANQNLSRSLPGTNEDIEKPQSSGDAAYWMSEWQRYEDENAVVDVDVRGWIYTPQRGPMSRRNRLIIAVARRLSGIPAPTTSPTMSRGSSPQPVNRVPMDDKPTKTEEEIAVKEAEMIARHGQAEADAASRGSYSAAQLHPGDSASIARSSSPSRFRRTLQRSHSFTDSEAGSEDEDPSRRSIAKRLSWNNPSNMSKEDLVKANDMLMTRLRPFLTSPLANTTITVFFFNDKKSQSKSVTTNDSGHFNVRAALDFVPTTVRVLASDKLSLTEQVAITESTGISLISDIDDTIKHSAIASGAREIFKNTFIRDLGELTIKGVKEWYNRVAEMGVKMHYVSNSPWQLYPLLRSYFTLAGLPPGSFHLKQYTGMLQGIFEPAAERKKGSLERIMNDFPDRKFILVGDSGEADLEVYTDIVLSYPRRILAVFIRDVTTASKARFFEGSTPHSYVGTPSGTPPASPHFSATGADRGRESRARDIPGQRPQLPSRPKPGNELEGPVQEPELLIDFTEEPTPLDLGKPSLYSNDLQQLNPNDKLSKSSKPPTKPAKPSNLRNISTMSPPPATPQLPSMDNGSSKLETKKSPPPPPKPRRSSAAVDLASSAQKQSSSSSSTSTNGNKSKESSLSSTHLQPPRPRAVHAQTSTGAIPTSSVNDDTGYAASARKQLTTTSNMKSTSSSRGDGGRTPPFQPRRTLTSSATKWVTGAVGGDPAAGGDGGAAGLPYNKKEEIWKRRWARAEEIMMHRGILLKTWRVGSDVMDECIHIIEKAMRDSERTSRS